MKDKLIWKVKKSGLAPNFQTCYECHMLRFQQSFQTFSDLYKFHKKEKKKSAMDREIYICFRNWFIELFANKTEIK